MVTAVRVFIVRLGRVLFGISLDLSVHLDKLFRGGVYHISVAKSDSLGRVEEREECNGESGSHGRVSWSCLRKD